MVKTHLCEADAFDSDAQADRGVLGGRGGEGGGEMEGGLALAVCLPFSFLLERRVEGVKGSREES